MTEVIRMDIEYRGRETGLVFDLRHEGKRGTVYVQLIAGQRCPSQMSGPSWGVRLVNALIRSLDPNFQRRVN